MPFGPSAFHEALRSQGPWVELVVEAARMWHDQGKASCPSLLPSLGKTTCWTCFDEHGGREFSLILFNFPRKAD